MKRLVTYFVALFFVVFGLTFSTANDNPALSEKYDLDGKWLFDSAMLQSRDRLNQVWSSVVSVSSGHFTISNFLDPSKELRGTIRRVRSDDESLDQVDIDLEELDFSSLGEPVKIEASTLKGVLRFDGEDAITLAIATSSSQERPTKFESTKTVLLIHLRRAPKGFKELPKEVTIEVESADGKPVEGAIAAEFLSKGTPSNEADVSHKYAQEKKTDSAGLVVFPYTELPRLIVDEQAREIAFPRLSPWLVVEGKIKVKLAPMCKVRGSIVCDELSKAEQPLGWTNVCLEAHGSAVADCSSEKGEFEFIVPNGVYTLRAYGSSVSTGKVSFSVQPNQLDAKIDPIALKALALKLLTGKPAPEFVDVAGWSGQPVKLSDLKGKCVIVDFWGYWCGPCVRAMPILIELQEKFGSKGLVIVGVHVDANGEVNSEEKLKEKTKHLSSGLWRGKELPFSNALVSGELVDEGDSPQRGGTLQVYGIERFPTTILIDPNGNIAGQFPVDNLKDSTEMVEKILELFKQSQ